MRRLVASLLQAPPGTMVVTLPGMTLMPGMIEGRSHLFLHPYNEKLWDVSPTSLRWLATPLATSRQCVPSVS